MNKKLLFQSIKRLTAALVLSYFLLVGGSGGQAVTAESQEKATYTVQLDETATEVAFSFIPNPIPNLVNWAS